MRPSLPAPLGFVTSALPTSSTLLLPGRQMPVVAVVLLVLGDAFAGEVLDEAHLVLTVHRGRDGPQRWSPTRPFPRRRPGRPLESSATCSTGSFVDARWDPPRPGSSRIEPTPESDGGHTIVRIHGGGTSDRRRGEATVVVPSIAHAFGIGKAANAAAAPPGSTAERRCWRPTSPHLPTPRPQRRMPGTERPRPVSRFAGPAPIRRLDADGGGRWAVTGRHRTHDADPANGRDYHLFATGRYHAALTASMPWLSAPISRTRGEATGPSDGRELCRI